MNPSPTPRATIADLRIPSCHGLIVFCQTVACMHMTTLSFDDLALPDDTVFVEIPKLRRLVCSGCSTRATQVMPDWPVHPAERAMTDAPHLLTPGPSPRPLRRTAARPDPHAYGFQRRGRWNGLVLSGYRLHAPVRAAQKPAAPAEAEQTDNI